MPVAAARAACLFWLTKARAGREVIGAHTVGPARALRLEPCEPGTSQIICEVESDEP